MGNSFEVKFTSHSKEVKQVMADRIEKALEECGLVAEGYAIRLCPVDTGLLRNSITHALDGEPPKKDGYSDDEGKKSGVYNGTAPTETNGRSVYIGTNVEYAAYVEVGTINTAPQRFIKPAVADHTGQYKTIIKNTLKNG